MRPAAAQSLRRRGCLRMKRRGEPPGWSGGDFERFQGGEHRDQNRSFLPVDVLEIRIAAVALDPPQTGRQEFRGDPAAGIDAVWNSDGGPGADADEMPLVIAPRVEPGLILFAVIRVLKQVI